MQKPMKDSDSTYKHRRHRLARALLLTLGGIAGLVLIVAIGVSWYLTPERLTRIVNSRASEYLKADVRLENLRFTLWSTFPRLELQGDSLNVKARTLAHLDARIRAQLPPDADFLLSTGRFAGGVNLMQLIMGRVKLHNVMVSDLRVNLVNVDDSTANYFILPAGDTTRVKIPQMEVNEIRLVNPRTLSYRSLQTGMSIDMKLDEARLRRIGGDNYDLSASGMLNAELRRLQFLTDFPVSLDGDVSLRFSPLRVGFHDYAIRLGNMRSNVSMDLGLEDRLSVDRFSYRVNTFRLMKLLEYLPESYLPQLRQVRGNLEVNATARLLSPFHLSDGTLPSVEVDFNIQDGDLSYELDSRRPLTLRHEHMKAVLHLDGRNPAATYVDIPEFGLTGCGVRLGVKGRVTGIITDTMHVSARLDIGADAANVARYVPGMRLCSPHGRLAMAADLDFDMTGGGSPEFSDITVKGEGRVLRPRARTADLRVAADSLRFSFNSHSDLATIEGFRGGLADASVTAHGVTLLGDSLGVSARRLDVAGHGMARGRIAAGKAIVSARLEAPRLDIPAMRLRLADLAASMTIGDSLSVRPGRDRLYTVDAQPDSRWLKTWGHTPEFLSFHTGEGFRNFLASQALAFTVTSSGGRIDIPGFPHPVGIGALALRADNDHVVIDHFSGSCDGSSVAVSGRLPHIGRVLLSDTPQPILADLNINMDTFDINNLARAFHFDNPAADTKTEESASVPAPAVPMSEAPMPAMLLPRNIDAHVHLHCARTLYINLDVCNLDADIYCKGGDLHIPRLCAETSFAKADVEVAYNSSDMEEMCLEIGGHLNDVNLVGFFRKFGTLVRKMPSLRNVSGDVSLGFAMKMGVNPDMKVDMASLTGDVQLDIDNMEVKQNDFIHRLARMMMIFDHRPIRVDDISLRAAVHDNLLEIYPFYFQFEKYRLEGMGVNNFGADLDYHIGVLRSPLHIPFGIDIEGTYHHPKLRPGRAGWSGKRAWSITGNIEKSFSFNLMKEMKWFGNKFMVNAATRKEL